VAVGLLQLVTFKSEGRKKVGRAVAARTGAMVLLLLILVLLVGAVDVVAALVFVFLTLDLVFVCFVVHRLSNAF
jgi:hypothetical protein